MEAIQEDDSAPPGRPPGQRKMMLQHQFFRGTNPRATPEVMARSATQTSAWFRHNVENESIEEKLKLERFWAQNGRLVPQAGAKAGQQS